MMQQRNPLRLAWDADRYDYVSIHIFFLVTWNLWDHTGPSRFANVLCFSFLDDCDLQTVCCTCYGIYIDVMTSTFGLTSIIAQRRFVALTDHRAFLLVHWTPALDFESGGALPSAALRKPNGWKAIWMNVR